MTKTWIIRLALAAVALAALAWLAAPVFAVKGLIHAARAGDAHGLERHVDFPAVREDLKLQLRSRLVDHLRDDPEMARNPWAGLGLALAPALVDGAVDAFITPQAIGAMVRSAEAPEPIIAGERLPGAEPSAPQDDDEDVSIRYSYRDINTFGARVIDPDRPDQPIDFLMTRQGLFAWKLTRIVLPPETGRID
jgi:hypothetical protein